MRSSGCFSAMPDLKNREKTRPPPARTNRRGPQKTTVERSVSAAATARASSSGGDYSVHVGLTGHQAALDLCAGWVFEDFRAGDFANWASRFSDDAVFQAPNQPAFNGKTAIQGWAEALPPIEAVEFTNVRVWGDGNVAWGVSDYALTLQGMPSDRGKQLAVCRRTNGAWQVVAVSFSSDLPLPEAAGAGSQP